MQTVEELRMTLRVRGPSRAPELQAALDVSQPTVSRAVRSLGDEVLRVGRGRRTTYALRRAIEGVVGPPTVHEVGAHPGESRALCRLHPIWPDHAMWVEPLADDAPGGFFDGLPWFLHDLRPSGFLGRLVPAQHPDLDVPDDILRWSGDDTLRYLTQVGWDLPGALVVGDAPYARYLAHALEPGDVVTDRERAWPSRAALVLETGTPGSSAAGERPKFLATARWGDTDTPVLVKFSPPRVDAVGHRIADLLICEALALQTLHSAGIPAARGRIVEADARVFLETARFDRVGTTGRRGVASLEALDAEHVGSDLASWSGTTRALLAQGRIDAADHRTVRWLEWFGRWIGNTDMHHANLAFFLRGGSLGGVAPAYDMGPMAWFPRGHELIEVTPDWPLPMPADADVVRPAWRAARELWRSAATDTRISTDFRAVAREAGERLQRLESVLDLLPAA